MFLFIRGFVSAVSHSYTHLEHHSCDGGPGFHRFGSFSSIKETL